MRLTKRTKKLMGIKSSALNEKQIQEWSDVDNNTVTIINQEIPNIVNEMIRYGRDGINRTQIDDLRSAIERAQGACVWMKMVLENYRDLIIRSENGLDENDQNLLELANNSQIGEEWGEDINDGINYFNVIIKRLIEYKDLVEKIRNSLNSLIQSRISIDKNYQEIMNTLDIIGDIRQIWQ